MCAVAAGVIAIAPMAQARRHRNRNTTDTATTTTTTSTDTSTTSSGSMSGGSMGSGTGSSMMMSSTPTQVTGQVLRYYVDRTGYVTAMDIQTANGTEMVRFAPGMGQRIFSTYPVGGQASVWVMGSPYGTGMTRWDVVGMGNTMPTVMMQPYTVRDVDLLQAEPYIMAGTKLVTIAGKLRRFVVGPTGEVLGLVLTNPTMPSMMNRHLKNSGASMTNASMTTDTTSGSMSGGMMSSDMTMMSGDVLVRVPREERQIDPGAAGTARLAPLFKGADVEVTGYPEAPRYGVISLYPNRIDATALVVNGRAVGAVGFPRMMRRRGETLFGFDLMGTDKNKRTPEEMNAAQMGYTIYDPSGMSVGTGGMNGTGTTPGTSGGTSSSSTTTGTSQ